MTLTKPIQLPLKRAPQSICILRLSALGDVCNAVPTVRALQRQWPDCRITWILGKTELQLLQGLEGVELLAYDKSSGLKGMREIRKQLKGCQFDILLHMQQALRASLLSLFIPARVRIGYDKARSKDYQHWFTGYHLPPHPRSHVLEGFLDFAHALGVDPHPLTWNISVPEAAYEQATALAPEKPYLILSPCSNQRARNFRNWVPEGYAEVIDHAYEKYGLETLMTGGTTTTEHAFGEQISELTNHKPVNLIGKTPLKVLLALIERARLVVAPDSGPAHMGTAMNTPVLGLYASTNPDRAAPYLSRDWVVNQYPQQVREHFKCAVEEISWGTRVRAPDVMSGISSAQVLKKFDQLMADTEETTTPS